MPEKKLLVDLNVAGGSIISRFLNSKSKNYDLQDIEILRKIFSNEKMKILFVLKKKKPDSIYSLAKILKRDFKSVYSDLKILERFGFIEFFSQKKGKRERLKPTLKINKLNIEISV